MNILLLHQRTPLINYAPVRWDWSSAGRDYYNLWICIEGEGEMLFNNEKIEVFPGVGILLPREGRVEGRKTDRGLLSNIGMHFQPRQPEDELAWIAHTGVPVQLQHFSLIRELAVYLEFLLFQAAGDIQGEENRLGGTLLSVFLRDILMGPESAVDRNIRKQAEEMRVQPERTRSGEELADTVGLSLSQFARRFHRLYGMSPHDFLIEQRINKARTQLRESQMTVAEIAETLGYRDVGYFSRQYKQKTGLSPLGERKRYTQRF